MAGTKKMNKRRFILKKIFKPFFIAVVLLFGTVAVAENNTAIAVLNFDTVGVAVHIGKAVSDIITTEINKKREIKIIERTQIRTIIEEQGFQKSACAESSCAVKIGKILSVNKIIIGSVVKMGEKFIVTGKVVDVETAQLDYSENERCYKEEEIESASQIVALKLLNEITGKSFALDNTGNEDRNRFSVGVMGIYGNMPRLTVPYLNPQGDYSKTKKIAKQFRGINISAGYDLTHYLSIKLDGSYFYMPDPSNKRPYYDYFSTPTVRFSVMSKNKDIYGYDYSVDFQLNRSLKAFTTFINIGFGNNIIKVDNYSVQSIDFLEAFNSLFTRTLHYDITLNGYNIFSKASAGLSLKLIQNMDFILTLGTKYVFYEKTKTKIKKREEEFYNYQSVQNAEELSQEYVPPDGTHKNSRRNFFSEFSISAGFLFRIF